MSNSGRRGAQGKGWVTAVESTGAERKRPKDEDPDKEQMLRHPSDASQWKAVDLEYYKI